MSDSQHTHYTCPKCGTVTGRPRDVEHGWCCHCSDWTEDFLSYPRERVNPW